MSEMKIADRADEAAHEAVLELVKANPLQHSLTSPQSGSRAADNLIDLHKKLAAYYRSLEDDRY